MENFIKQESGAKNPISDLEKVGKEKPIGYLPIDTINECKSSVAMEQRKAKQRGQQSVLLEKEKTDIASGALYIYDEVELNTRLKNNQKLLEENNFPTTSEEFIRHLGNNTVEAKTKMFDFIADCFNDKTNSGRTDISS